MTSRARKTRFMVMRRSLGSVNQCPKSTNRFLEGSDTISDIAIIDIHRIDLGETLQRCFRLTSGFLGNPQIIPQREDAFRLDAGSTEGALIPDSGNARLAFLHKSQTEKGAALHDIAEGLATVRGLGDFLKFADGFIDETHLAESDSEIVVSLEVLILRAHFAKFGAEVVKDFLERTVLGRSCRFLLELRRSGWRSGFGKSRSQFVDAKLVNLAGQIRKKLVGGKAAGRRGSSRILASSGRFRFRNRNRYRGRL